LTQEERGDTRRGAGLFFWNVQMRKDFKEATFEKNPKSVQAAAGRGRRQVLGGIAESH